MGQKNKKKDRRKKQTRKERRKNERIAKKAKKNDFFMKKSSKIKEDIINEVIKKNKFAPSVKKKKCKSSKSLTKNDIRKLQLKEAITEDDKAINRLEKQLKLKNRKKKIPKSFHDDGLGYLLEVIDKSDEISQKEEISERLLNLKKFNKKEKSDLSQSDSAESFYENDSAESVVDDNMDIESKNKASNEFDDDDNSADDDHNDIDEYDSNENNKEIKKNKQKIWEDIYGRLRDEKGNVIKTDCKSNESFQKYIPPAKRLSSTTDVQKQEKLKIITKQLRGLLNRLSESNMQPICYQIEEIYMKNSRNDVNETLSSLIMELIISPALMANKLIMEYAMLIALLHGNIGEEIGAYFLQTWICKLEDFLKDRNNYYEGKMIDNLICFVVHLFTFKVTSSILIYDILNKLIENFQEKDLELILLILKNVGFSLRKDNPSALRNVILEIQKKAADVSLKHDQSRIRFMLDTLTAIRNNNMYKIQNYDPDLIEHMKKMLRSYLHKGCAVQEMRISYDDLLKADKGGGRWWIVGSAWDNSAEKNNQKENVNIQKQNESFNYSENLLHKAKIYNMNTNVRKTIFCIIASAEDYLDAFSKLLRLDLRSAQYREIILVILDCCLQENPFNLFYVILADKFCQFERKYRMALQCAIWDKIKYIDGLILSRRNNFADFLLHCFLRESLNITVLKVMSFSDLNVKMMKFLKRIFCKLLLKHSEEECAKIFCKIPKEEKAFKESIKLFMMMFVDKNKEIVQNRLKLLELSNKQFKKL